MKSMIPPLASILAAALLLFCAGELRAQVGIGVEGRAGVTFPVGDLSDADAESGLVIGGEMILNLHPSFSGYLNLQRHGFSCDDGCEVGDDPRVTTLGAGVKYILPSPPDALMWVRGGVMAGRYSDDAVSGDRSAGLEAGAGIDMLITDRVFIVPHLGYYQVDAAGPAATASYLTFGIGAHYHLR